MSTPRGVFSVAISVHVYIGFSAQLKLISQSTVKMWRPWETSEMSEPQPPTKINK